MVLVWRWGGGVIGGIKRWNCDVVLGMGMVVCGGSRNILVAEIYTLMLLWSGNCLLVLSFMRACLCMCVVEELKCTQGMYLSLDVLLCYVLLA